jgi:hypothetical protein
MAEVIVQGEIRGAQAPDDLPALLREYVAAATAPGAERERLDAWAPLRATARRHWEELLESERFGRDVSEAAIWKLIPHAEGALAQRHAAFVHPLAPAVDRELHDWFETAGWVRREQWPDLGRGLFDLVRRCTDHPNELWPAMEAFLAVPGASAFTAEMIAPMLHALRPTEFVLLDAACRTLLNHATGSAFSNSLRDFPAAHAAARRLLAELRPALADSALCDRRPEDVLDGFCHWVVHVRMMRREEPPAVEAAAPVAAAPVAMVVDAPAPVEAPAAAQAAPPAEVSPPTAPSPEAPAAAAAIPSAPVAGAPMEAPAAALVFELPEPVLEEFILEDLLLEEPPPELLAESERPTEPAPSPSMLIEAARAALERRGQLVLAGPAGSGKSHLARRLAEELVAGGDGFVQHIVLHAGWRYADFLQGCAPDDSIRPGFFAGFCGQAAARRGPCVLIVDDAERGDVADVCGEALSLLDQRGLAFALPRGGELAVPANVRVIFTLEDGTRSGRRALVELVRACAVLRVDGEEELRRRHPGASFVEPLLALRRAVGAELGDAEGGLPMAFFLRARLPFELEAVWRADVEPFLAVALAFEPAQAAAFRWEAVAERLR